MLRKSFVLLVMGTVISFFASVSSADVPHMINYQGKLTTASGGCLNDTVQMTFSIYPDTLGSTADWSETQTDVVVKEGIFNVLLGAVDTIPQAVFDGNIKYLGVQVESDPEMRPLKPMVSVAYAYRAAAADGGGGWVDDGTVVRLEDTTDQVGIGTTAPSADLDVDGDIYTEGGDGDADLSGVLNPGDLSTINNILSGMPFSKEQIAHADVDGDGRVTWDDYGMVWRLFIGDSRDEAKRKIHGTYGALDEGIFYVRDTVGIGTTNPSAELDVVGDVNINSVYRIGGDAVLSTEGTTNTFVGAGAGAANSTGHSNTFVGEYAGFSNTTGYENTFVGVRAGSANTESDENTFLGYWAGFDNTEGVRNTFLGWSAGRSNTTGYQNTFVGHAAGLYDTSGYDNTFVGVGAGRHNTEGFRNTFVGEVAGYENTTGERNTFLGRNAGFSNTEGKGNTFIGTEAGYSNITGDFNVFIGYNAGYGQDVSHKLYIENGSGVLIYGDFLTGNVGIGTEDPTAALDVDGSTGYNQVRMRTSYTPTGSNDPNGNEGDIAWDDDFFYVKTMYGWRRTALTIF